MDIAYIFSSIALLASVTGFFYIRQYVKKRTSVERIPQDVRDAVNQIINEIDRITDRDSMLIEDRVHKLQKILEETDKRLNLLIKESEARRPAGISANIQSPLKQETPSIRQLKPETPAPQNKDGAKQTEKAGKPADGGFDLYRIAEDFARFEKETPAKAASGSQNPPPEAAAGEEPEENAPPKKNAAKKAKGSNGIKKTKNNGKNAPQTQTAAQMAAQGVPPAQIAARLDKTVTEVEMEIFMENRTSGKAQD
ncbi:MAG: hypothetical protein LBC53_00465 [Spirochaetaceae bacterium]|nr:hypothetical protein [Spirochaetaceae bacterium]